MFPTRRLIARLVVLELSCGDCPIAALPPELDPAVGDVITCAVCGRDATVQSVTSQADLAKSDDAARSDRAADTPILPGPEDL